MKSPIARLPCLMVLGFAAAVAAQTPVAHPAETGFDRDAEVGQLRQDLRVISGRLEQLKTEGHHVVPRGGLSSALIGEADYVLNRTVSERQPGRVVIGASR